MCCSAESTKKADLEIPLALAALSILTSLYSGTVIFTLWVLGAMKAKSISARYKKLSLVYRLELSEKILFCGFHIAQVSLEPDSGRQKNAVGFMGCSCAININPGIPAAVVNTVGIPFG